jgi:hypothetical protein
MLLALWVIQPIIQAVIATVMYRRKLHKEFPAFFAYVVAQVPIFCIHFVAYLYGGSGGHGVYFATYWMAAALNLLFAFKIIHEIFVDVFKPYHALKDLGVALFKWAAFIMVMVSAVLISVNPSRVDPLMTTILVVQRCIAVVQCGLVVFLLAFSGHLGVSWRRLSFGIALGFGVVSGGELLLTVLYSGMRTNSNLTSIMSMGSYDLGMLVCLFYSLANRTRDLVPVLVPQRWDEALMDIQAPQSEADSLIPMFEHMVDQALSKSNSTHA